MPSVGSYLRELRERRGLSLDEIARVTRVPRRYLEALEADEAGVLPTPVFTKGYIRAYCQAVQQPPEEALALYTTSREPSPPPVDAPRDRPTAEAPRPAPAPRHIRPVERESRSRGPVLVSFVLLVVLGVALFAVTLSLQPGPSGPERQGETAQEAAPPPEPPPRRGEAVRSMPQVTRAPEAVRPPAVPAPVAPAPAPPHPETAKPFTPPSPPTPAPPKPPAGREPGIATREPGTISGHEASQREANGPAATAGSAGGVEPRRLTEPAAAAGEPTTTDSRGLPPLALSPVNSPFRLVARATEATWVRVRTEDGATTEETIPAGSIREWASDRPFTVTLGNAGGVTLELNGQRLPRLGPSGAVVRGLVLPPRTP